MKTTDQLWFRFALWFSTFVLVTWIAFSILTFSLFRARLDEALDNSLSLSASQALAAVNIEDGILNLTDSIPDLSALGTVLEGGFLVQILDPAGKALLSSGGMSIDPASLSEARPASTRSFFSSGPEATPKGRFRAISVPILVAKKQVGTLRIFRGLASVDHALNGLLASLLAVLPFFILLSFVGTTLIARRSLLPVKRMMEAATLISENDLTLRLPMSGRDDELGRLARVFNEVLGRLERAFDKEKRFTADASHELRTPLTALQAILGATLAQDRDAGAYRQALHDAEGQVSRLIRLSNDLLLLAKQGEPSLSTPAVFDLAVLAEDVVAGLEPLAAEKGIHISCEAKEPALVTGDRDALARALFNIVGNAVKFTDSGEVIVTVEARGTCEVVAIVRDTGIGIESSELGIIFDRFYRVSSSRAGEGAGLGLSLAKEIVARHRGRIDVESWSGQGSIFTVLLPRT